MLVIFSLNIDGITKICNIVTYQLKFSWSDVQVITTRLVVELVWYIFGVEKRVFLYDCGSALVFTFLFFLLFFGVSGLEELTRFLTKQF